MMQRTALTGLDLLVWNQGDLPQVKMQHPWYFVMETEQEPFVPFTFHRFEGPEVHSKENKQEVWEFDMDTDDEENEADAQQQEDVERVVAMASADHVTGEKFIDHILYVNRRDWSRAMGISYESSSRQNQSVSKAVRVRKSRVSNPFKRRTP